MIEYYVIPADEKGRPSLNGAAIVSEKKFLWEHAVAELDAYLLSKCAQPSLEAAQATQMATFDNAGYGSYLVRRLRGDRWQWDYGNGHWHDTPEAAMNAFP